MKVLVCGGRTFDDKDAVFTALDELDQECSITEIIQGEARGADQLSALWASCNGVVCRSFPADWSNLGLSAGPIRNRQMLIEGNPDIVVAFPGGKGTANMVAQAERAGVPVRRFHERTVETSLRSTDDRQRTNQPAARRKGL